jgi:hypothetical protein
MSAPNPHVEEWKRFAAAHMRWINFEFDRIVADAIKRATDPKLGDVVWYSGNPIGVVTALTSGDRKSPGVLVSTRAWPAVMGIKQADLQHFRFKSFWPVEWLT